MKSIFLTVLGTSDYRECYYSYQGEEIRCKFVQESLIKFLFKPSSDFDVKVLLTKKAHIKNYLPSGKGESLEEVFNRLNIEPELIFIPEGKNEDELWDIFYKTSEIVKDYDKDTEIILDITHSLRNIPIQVMVALNYAKLFNKVNLSGIYYGGFEIGEDKDDSLHKNEKIKYAPICNLNTYIELLNWTNAINSFDKTGNAKEIIDLYDNKKKILYKNTSKDEKKKLSSFTNVIDSIYDFTQCINTCRGDLLAHPSVFKYKEKSIGSAAYKLYTSIDNLNCDTTMSHLTPLFSIVKKKIEPFITESNFEIGLATVEWCINYKLFQQGFTALDETIKTFICEQLNLHENPNETKKIKKHREYIASTALHCMSIEECEWEFNSSLNEKEIESTKKTIYILSKNKEFKGLVNCINQKRNDINHFGFRGYHASNYDSLSSDLEKYYETFLKLKDSIDLSSIHF